MFVLQKTTLFLFAIFLSRLIQGLTSMNRQTAEQKAEKMFFHAYNNNQKGLVQEAA